LTSVGRFVAGGSYLTGTTHTTCVNGKRYAANVRAFFVGAAVGLPVGHTGFDLEVSDNATGQGNLNNLSGLASMVSLSGAFGLPGASVSQIVLGQAQTTFPLGTQYGIYLSAPAGGGWSFVSNVHQEDCCK
jgi:hypothetical protein